MGKQAITELWKNISDSQDLSFLNDTKDEITFTFELACLLHDLGHAPFSHTGENFYKVKKIDATLQNFSYFEQYIKKKHLDKFCYLDGMLINELCEFYDVADEDISRNEIIKEFLKDYSQVLQEDSAKPHEKMSALISLREMKEKILSLAGKVKGIQSENETGVVFNADLFVRCITGTKYLAKTLDAEESKMYSFKNAIISLLNSDIIDVDKLDYILRDNYMTGYKNTGIDVERLIKSYTIILEEGKWCRLAYKKNALSVIENVIIANDSSRRWVQSHPIIMYDSYITQRCVSETFQILQTELEKQGSLKENLFEKFFSADAITETGIQWINGELA